MSIDSHPHSVRTGSTYEQIRAQAPSQAVGFRVEVHQTDGKVLTFPRRVRASGKEANQGLPYYKLHPYQAPMGMPQGRHLVHFLAADGQQVGEGTLDYYPLLAPPAREGAKPAGPGSPQEAMNQLERVQQEQMRVAARAKAIELSDAFTKNQAGLLANNQQMAQDTAEAYRTMLESTVAVSTQATEAAVALLRGINALAEATSAHAKRVAELQPQAPPPPQDWAGVVKEGVNVIGDLAESWGLKRKRQGQIEESSRKIEIKEQLPGGSGEKEPVDAETTEKTAGKESDRKDPDDSDPPSAPAAAKPPTASPTKPKENRQETAKRALHRVLLACASVQPQHIYRFLHDPPFLLRFLSHLRVMMFPVTSWRWRLA